MSHPDIDFVLVHNSLAERFRLLVCRLKPPDDARTLPQGRGHQSVAWPAEQLPDRHARDYLQRPRDVIAGIQHVDSIFRHIALPISGGSTTELSATDAWLGAVVGDATYIGTIRKASLSGSGR
jgi:hypothetical protein